MAKDLHIQDVKIAHCDACATLLKEDVTTTDDVPTIADLSAVCEIEQACLDHAPLVHGFSALTRWLTTMRAIPVLKAAQNDLPQLHKAMVEKQDTSKFLGALRAGAIDT